MSSASHNINPKAHLILIHLCKSIGEPIDAGEQTNDGFKVQTLVNKTKVETQLLSTMIIILQYNLHPAL